MTNIDLVKSPITSEQSIAYEIICDQMAHILGVPDIKTQYGSLILFWTTPEYIIDIEILANGSYDYYLKECKEVGKTYMSSSFICAFPPDMTKVLIEAGIVH